MKIFKTTIFPTVVTGALILYLYQSYVLIPSAQEQFGIDLLELNLQTTINDNDENEHKMIKRAEIEIANSNNFAGKDKILKKHFMIIVIPSMSKSQEFRHLLRTKWLNMSSWGSHEFEGVDTKYLDFKLMFVVGKKKSGDYSDDFIKEMSTYDDIHLIDVTESRWILKDKVLFGMKKSVELFDYKYFIKIDHDTLVDLPNLAKGIQTLPDENVYTGACTFRIAKGEYKNLFNYCGGGGYILSRDLIEKITALPEEEINISLNPEDGYTGWLVAEVKRKFNISKTLPVKNRNILNRMRYEATTGKYRFNRWFYHWLKSVRALERVFTCRVNANFTQCPRKRYHFENTTCLCTV